MKNGKFSVWKIMNFRKMRFGRGRLFCCNVAVKGEKNRAITDMMEDILSEVRTIVYCFHFCKVIRALNLRQE